MAAAPWCTAAPACSMSISCEWCSGMRTCLAFLARSMSDWNTAGRIVKAFSPYMARQFTVPVVHCAAWWPSCGSVVRGRGQRWAGGLVSFGTFSGWMVCLSAPLEHGRLSVRLSKAAGLRHEHGAAAERRRRCAPARKCCRPRGASWGHAAGGGAAPSWPIQLAGRPPAAAREGGGAEGSKGALCRVMAALPDNWALRCRAGRAEGPQERCSGVVRAAGRRATASSPQQCVISLWQSAWAGRGPGTPLHGAACMSST